MLLLENGTATEELDVGPPRSVRLWTRFEDADFEDEEGDDGEDFEPVDDIAEEDMDTDDEDSAETASQLDESDQGEDADGQDTPNDLAAEIQELRKDIKEATLKEFLTDPDREPLDSALLDKVRFLRRAFPSAPARKCEEVFVESGRNPKKAFRVLQRSFDPARTWSEVRRLSDGCLRGSENQSLENGVNGIRENSYSYSLPAADETEIGPTISTITATNANRGQSIAEVTMISVVPRKSTPNDASYDNDTDTNSSGESSLEEVDWASNVVSVDADETSSSGSDDEDASSLGSDEEEDDGTSVSPGINSRADPDSSPDDDNSDTSSSGESSDSETESRRKQVETLDEASMSEDTDTGHSGDSTSSEEDSSDDDSRTESSSDPKPQEASLKATPIQSMVRSTSHEREITPKPSLKPHVSPVSTARAGSVQLNGVSVEAAVTGPTKSQRRAARRRRRKLLLQSSEGLQEIGDNMPDAVDQQASPKVDPTSKRLLPDERNELIAKKQALLGAIENATTASPKGKRKFGALEAPPETPIPVTDIPSAGTSTHQEQDAPNSTEGGSTSQHRLRLDVAAGRRMLFGALGVRPPKTKADEDKIRTNLMKDVRPLVNMRLVEENDPQANAAANANPKPHTQRQLVDEDPDAWKEKITYRAIECCQEGVELSDPPFPFVQRWDPQQQLNWNGAGRGGKRKRAQRNQAHFYQEDSRQEAVKKRRVDTDLNYDDPVENANEELQHDEDGAIGAPLNGDWTHKPTMKSQKTDEDLPTLPKDLSALPSLLPGQAEAGMVITWKKWLLSKGTNWQPILADVMAVVVAVDESAGSMQLLLSKRDRQLDSNEKVYDKDTGARIYERFEAPDSTSEDDESETLDEGYRIVYFNEIAEPRIVQHPRIGSSFPASAAASPLVTNKVIPNSNPPNINGGLGCTAPTVPEEINSIASADPKVNPETVLVPAPATEDANRAPPRDFPQPEFAVELPLQIASRASAEVVEDQFEAHGSRDVSKQGSLLLANLRREQLAHPTPISPEPSTSPVLASNSNSPPSSLQLPLADSDIIDTIAEHFQKLESPKQVAYSSASGRHNGRQPDHAEFGIEPGESLNPVDGDNSAAATTPRVNNSTPPPRRNTRSLRSSILGSAQNPSTTSTFPSITAVWQTARTRQKTQSTQSTQSPPMSAVLGTKKGRRAAARDLTYDKAVRHIDEATVKEDESPKDLNPARNLFQNASQPVKAFSRPTSGLGISETQGAVLRRAIRSRTSTNGRRTSSPVVPSGSEVIDLLLDPSRESSIVAEENYAEDSLDNDYNDFGPSTSLSTLNESGWVKKTRKSISDAPIPMPLPSSSVESSPNAPRRSTRRKSRGLV
jgi:hypothetical protein